MKAVGIILAAVVLAGAAFWGGIAYTNGTSGGAAASANGFPGAPTGADGQFRGGPMANLTEEERTRLQGMSDEERQAFFQEKMGDQAPPAGAGGQRSGAVEGEILEIADDTITVKLADSGSTTIYTDENTVVGYAKGVTEMSAGSKIIAIVTPEADGVNTASAIVVQ